MRPSLILLILVCMSACSGNRVGSDDRSLGNEHIAIWRASRSEGDKPGMGIELRFSGKGVKGTYFIMDPSDPSNFRQGRSVPMKTISDGPKRLVFAVQLPGSNDWQFGIRFDHPLAGKSVKAMMEWTQSFELPLEFRLVSEKLR